MAAREFNGAGIHNLVKRRIGGAVGIPATLIIDPTLADNVAITASRSFGTNLMAWFSTIAGPTVLPINFASMAFAVSLRILFGFVGSDLERTGCNNFY